MRRNKFQSIKKRKTSLETVLALLCLVGSILAASAMADQELSNEPGILEPVTSHLESRDVRIPNTDQSIDGAQQTSIAGEVVVVEAETTTSLLGHPITQVTSPNDDMRWALQEVLIAAQADDSAAMKAAAQELQNILLGTTSGRIYDGFAMLNYNRGAFAPDHVADEYKMKKARDTGQTYTSPFDGEERRIWEIDVNLLYYDGQIDSDTFLAKFPVEAHPEDVLHVNYRIYSLVTEDFSPTLVMLDRRMALNTVQFPFKGFDAVWVAMEPGDVLNVTVKYPPVRLLRGVYTWGWRVHPPRIQFLQPVYEMVNQHTGEVELDPQGESYAYRNRTNLSLDTISDAAPEMKMLKLTQAILNQNANASTILLWLIDSNEGPRGTWVEWANLAKEQRQIPPEAWDLLAQEGIQPGEFADYQMISVFMNNEMYGDGPFQNEVRAWKQGEVFKIKLINLDKHTHYFRNVDFGTRLHDDILRCCGGGETSFEIMNFKPSYGAPKVAEMQWRAGFGFRPHYDIIQQQDVFSRGSDRVKLTPYTGGEGGHYYGYQYSEEHRDGDFRFNPPNFIIGEDEANPSSDRLRDVDGEEGLLLGQRTEGFGVAQLCPGDAYPGFCTADISAFNPNGVYNVDSDDDGVNDELHFPPFLRNPAQGDAQAGDIIPPTGAWQPFLWLNPANGTLFIDPDDPSKGYWADLTYSHGRPVYPGQTLRATVELPRAAGQVFYQFDDLFHDNAIFSPHPLAEGVDEVDDVVHLNAFVRNFLRVRGTLASLSTGDYAEWVALYGGAAGSEGCTGPVLADAPVNPANGFFVFRCGAEDRCSAPLLEQKGVGLAAFENFTLCVQSSIGGFGDFTIGGISGEAGEQQ